MIKIKKMLYCDFIDLKMTFDSVYRKGLWFKLINSGRTSDTLIGYLPIFQMLPKTSLCIRYHWYPFE